MPRDLRRFAEMEYAVGTDGTIAIALYDSAGAALGVSGASATWKLFKGVRGRRRKPWTGGILASKTSAAGQIALATGSATVTIADTDLPGISGLHWHTLEVTDASGNISMLGEGYIFLRAAAPAS